MEDESDRLGVVVIGRNEGDRLKRCLRSLKGQAETVVYVDSGSTDGSVEFARSLGVDVVNLDMAKPFTMARGRNAGFQRLEQIRPHVEYVQFVDGDCEVVEGWIEQAVAMLKEQPEVGSVAGHRREIDREATIFNRLTDLEWRGPSGKAQFLGGDVMMRVRAFRDTGGYQEQMIAGEDPEICVRLRKHGWTLFRVDHEMTRHDAAMKRFSQWWKRAVRSGHAYAECAWLHRASSEKPWRREVWRNWFWGLILPLAAIALAWPTYGISLTLFALYPLWIWRIARDRRQRFCDSTGDAWLYAFFCMLGKTPNALGQTLFWWRRLRGQSATLIEYKPAPDRGAVDA